MRRLVAAAAALVLSAGLAACTSADGSSGSSSSPTPSASRTSHGPVTLRVAVYGDQTRLDTYRRIADAFTRANPQVTIRLETYPDAATAETAALRGLTDGTGPDVFLADQYSLPALVNTGRLEPVDTLLEDRGLQVGEDYQRTAISSFSAYNRLQCMPAEMSPLVVYVNTGLVSRRQLLADQITVPTVQQPSWTWTDFTSIAQLVARSDLLGPIKGASVPLDLETLTAFVRSAGGEVVDNVLAPTTLDLASGSAQTALGQVMALDRDAAVAPTPGELSRRNVATWFTSGQLGMFVGTRDDLPQLRNTPGLRFDVWPLPSMGQPASVAQVNGYCIDAGSHAVDVASDFIAFAVGPRGSALAARSGVMVPARVATLNDPSFTDPGQQPPSAEQYAESTRHAEPMPFSTQWPEVASVADKTLASLLVDPQGPDPTTALEQAMTRLDRVSLHLFALGATPSPS